MSQTIEVSGSLHLSDLLGSWRNSDQGESGGILELRINEDAGNLKVRPFGAGRPEPYDWGEAEAIAYWNPAIPGRVYGFSATFELGFLTTHISAYHKSGILVATTYNVFNDDSGRCNYWTREFFYREQGLVHAT